MNGKYSWQIASQEIFGGKYTTSINKFIAKEHKSRQEISIGAGAV